jgi:exodeoxyribonuclease V
MKQAEEISALLLAGFPYAPTRSQQNLMIKIAGFLASPLKLRAFLLKGYAGTGKTTVISRLVNILPSLGMQSVLLAPTGRAAKVMGNYANTAAFTIHRKIYRITESNDGKFVPVLRENNYRNTLFIVDEASMIPGDTAGNSEFYTGNSLLEDLVHFVYGGENCTLLLSGDSAQLPPVGRELSPALDARFLKSAFSLEAESFELTEVVRQAEDSGILVCATQLRKRIAAGKASFPFFPLKDYPDVQRISGDGLEDALNSFGPGKGDNESVVICRSNKRAYLYNREIRHRILFREGELATGDVLMAVKNNYHWLPKGSGAGFIANGDMLEVMRIRKITEIYGFRFADATIRLVDEEGIPPMDVKLLLDSLAYEGPSLPQTEAAKLYKEVSLDYADIAKKRKRLESIAADPWLNAIQVKYAYALTCHKTQGGQWDHVFVEQGYLTADMINRDYLRWLYTAVTRATKTLWLVNFNPKFFG